MKKRYVALIAIAAIALAWIFLAPAISFFFFGMWEVVNSGNAQQIVDSAMDEIELVHSKTKESTIIRFQPTVGNQGYMILVERFGEGNQSKLIVSVAYSNNENKIIATNSIDLAETPLFLDKGEEKEALKVVPQQECLSVIKQEKLVVEKIDC